MNDSNARKKTGSSDAGGQPSRKRTAGIRSSERDSAEGQSAEKESSKKESTKKESTKKESAKKESAEKESTHIIEEFNPNAPEDFEAEISALVNQLSEAFGGGVTRWHYDEPSETLFIELEAIRNTSSEEIEAIAGPYLDATELDFEEIILLPLAN